jgi:hypothetical protein
MATNANDFGTLCPISLEQHFDVDPKAFAVQLMQRLGTVGLENLERSVRARGSRGVSNDDFVRDAIRCLGASASVPDSCAYPWQRKFVAMQDGTRQFESEPILGGFVPDVIDAHAGLNFADVSRGYPFHTAEGGSVVKREMEMGDFRREHTSIVKRGDPRRDNAPFQSLEAFSSVPAVEYALALLYRELDPCHSDRVCWEDVAAYLYDITCRGRRCLPTPWSSVVPLRYQRILRRSPQVFADPHEEFMLMVADPAAAAAVAFTKILVPPDSQRFYAATSQNHLLMIDSRSFQTKCRVPCFDPNFGAVSAWAYLRGLSTAAIATDDSKMRFFTNDGEHARIAWEQAFGTPQTVVRHFESSHRIFTGSRSGYLSVGVLPHHLTAASLEAFRMETFTAANTSTVRDIIYIDQSSTVAVACDDGAVRMYDFDTAMPRTASILNAHPVLALDYNNHYGLLAVACGTNPMLWAPDDPRTVAATLRDSKDTHRGAVTMVHFNLTSPTVLSGDSTGTVKIWDVRMLACLTTMRTCGTVGLVHRPELESPDAPLPQLYGVGPRMMDKYRAIPPAAAEERQPHDAVPQPVMPSALRSCQQSAYMQPSGNVTSFALTYGLTHDGRAMCWTSHGATSMNRRCHVAAYDDAHPTAMQVIPSDAGDEYDPVVFIGLSNGAILRGCASEPGWKIADGPIDESDDARLGHSTAVLALTAPVATVEDKGDGAGTLSGVYLDANDAAALLIVRPSAAEIKLLAMCDEAKVSSAFTPVVVPSFVSQGSGLRAKLSTGIWVWSLEYGTSVVVLGTENNVVRFVTGRVSGDKSVASAAAALGEAAKPVVSSIRSMPSVGAITKLHYIASISAVVALDTVGGVHLYNVPFQNTKMYPTCLFRTTAYQPPGFTYVPAPTGVLFSHHGLLGISAGTYIGFFDLAPMLLKAMPDGWARHHEAPLEMPGSFILPPPKAEEVAAYEAMLERKRVEESRLYDSATAKHGAPVAVERAIIDDRFKVLPPTPQLVHKVSLPETNGITAMVYDEDRRAVLVAGTDGRIHTVSLWGSHNAVARIADASPEDDAATEDDDAEEPGEDLRPRRERLGDARYIRLPAGARPRGRCACAVVDAVGGPPHETLQGRQGAAAERRSSHADGRRPGRQRRASDHDDRRAAAESAAGEARRPVAQAGPFGPTAASANGAQLQ